MVESRLTGEFSFDTRDSYLFLADIYIYVMFHIPFILISSRARSEQSLVRWATPQLHDIDALAKMVDPTLNGMYPAKSLSRFADIIALCVQVYFI